MHTISGNFVEIIWTGLATTFKVETPDGTHDNYASKSIVIQGIISGIPRDIDITVTPYRDGVLMSAQAKSLNIPANSFTPTDAGGSIPVFCRTYNDANVSGAALITRLVDRDGTYYYVKVYPTISASAGGTIDDIGYDLRGINNSNLSGTPKIAEFKSGGISYFFKMYPTIASDAESSAGTTLNPPYVDDAALSGSPRVARILLNSVYYYFKIYPTKA